MTVNFTSNGNPVVVHGYSFAYSGANAARWARIDLSCDGGPYNMVAYVHRSIIGASTSGFMKFNLSAGAHSCTAYVSQSHTSGRGGILVQQM